MDKVQILDEIKMNTEKINGILNLGETEKRSLTINELDEITNIKVRNLELNKSIEIEKNKIEKMENREFSLLRAINNQMKGISLDGIDKEVIEQGEKNLRSAGQVASGLAIPTQYLRAGVVTLVGNSSSILSTSVDKLNVISESLILSKVGATYGVSNSEFVLPSYSQSGAVWADEIADATDGVGSISSVKLSPKRLTAQITVSKKFLAMDTSFAEQILINDLVNAVSRKIDSTVLGKLSGNTTQPAGIFYTAPTISGTTTYANVISVEEKITSANGANGNLTWVVNPKVKSLFRTTAKLSNGQAIMEDNNTAIGYPLFTSNAVASGLQSGTNEYGAVLADFSQLYICQFGDSLDLTVDTITLAGKGEVLITVNFYVDAAFRHSAYYATASFK